MSPIRTCLITCLVLLFLGACSDEPAKHLPSDHSNVAGDMPILRDTAGNLLNYVSDTVLFVDAGGIRDSFQLNKFHASVLEVAIKLSLRYPGEIADTVLISIAELNGKRGSERILTSVSPKPEGISINRRIVSDTSIIWKDQIRLDTVFIAELRDVYPHLYNRFRRELHIANAFKMRPKFSYSPVPFIDDEGTFYLHEERLLKSGVDSTQINKKLNEYRRYLIGFRGRVLEIPDGNTSSLMIWYEPEKKFVSLWEP